MKSSVDLISQALGVIGHLLFDVKMAELAVLQGLFF